ncbi:hypothetical protein ABPG75_011590 [Micractinium tetrahymenae]
MVALVLLVCSLATSLLILTLKSRALDEARRHQQRQQQQPAATEQRQQQQAATAPAGAAARLQTLGGLLLLGGHLMAMLLRTDRSRLAEPAGLAAEAAVPLVLGVLLVALPALLPALFERHRTLLVGTARVAVFMAADVRNPRGLLFIFQRPPSEDLLRDTWQLLLGSRVVAMFCTAVACPLPLLPHLLVSAFAFHRCRLSDVLCSCPLLRHPVWQRRIAAMHSAIHKLPLLVPDPGPLACRVPGTAGALGSPSEGAQARDCRVFMAFTMLLGGLVGPTLLTAKTARSAGAAGAAGAAGTAGAAAGPARRVADGDSDGAGSSEPAGSSSSLDQVRSSSSSSSGGGATDDVHSGSRPPLQGGKWPGARCCAAVRAAASCAAGCLQRAACEADSCLHHLCELLLGSSSGVLAVAAWWMLLSLGWVTALLLERAGPAASAAI